MNSHDPHTRPDDTTPRRSAELGELFHRFAHRASLTVGAPWAFAVALLVVLVWGVTGPIFRFSDSWQLVINTGTTIVTFLMVFLIQNTQNRDAKAIHLKLDELIRSQKRARNALVDLEDMTEEELRHFEEEFKRIRRRADSRTHHGRPGPSDVAPTHERD
jgi:low affinity Fe/Cu permease